jgi:uncharacterized protein
MKLFLFIFLINSIAMAVESKEILVQGNCDIKIVPDRGIVNFTAENQSRDQQEAIKKTNQQMAQLKDRIAKLKLPDPEVKNTSYTVQPVREYENNRYVDKGTKVSLSLEVTTSDITRLGEAMVEASKVGIQNVGSLHTFMSIKQRQQEYLRCLDLAADDAKEKAAQLARKFKITLGSVSRIIESPIINQPGPYPEKSMMMMKSSSSMDIAAANIEPGTQNFSTSIQVAFTIK